jgi:hypothetical protein
VALVDDGPLDVREHAVEDRPQLVAPGGEDEDRAGQQGEDEEVEGAVDRDQPQHDPIAERPPPQGQLDLVALGRVAAAAIPIPRKRHPGIAAQAPVPAHALDLAGDDRVPGTKLGSIGADQLVAPDPADQELVVEARAKAPRARHAGQMFGRGDITGGIHAPKISGRAPPDRLA